MSAIHYALAVATAKQTKPSDLDLDDGPAKTADVFLVDGNGLAYRAFHALPEELQTAEGQPTNALLGMANMLMRMLADYRPATVLVAWDERPTKRLELDPEYKAHRKPTPPLLQAQRPYLRAAGGGVRLPQHPRRGDGGRRRDRHAVGDGRARPATASASSPPTVTRSSWPPTTSAS